MKTRRLLLHLVSAGLLLDASLAAQATRQLFVTVRDGNGAPVTDLATTDFTVVENGTTQPVTRVGLGADPMRIALVLDSGDGVKPHIGPFRQGLVAFIDGLPESTEVGVVTTGRRAQLRLQATADRKRLKEVAGGFFGDGGGTAILDGLLEAERRVLSKAADRWPSVVIVTTDHAGAGDLDERKLHRFIGDMVRADVAIHGIVVSTRGGGTPASVTLTAVQDTGGHYEAIAAASALPDRLRALAGQLSREYERAKTQYRIEYVSGVKDVAEAKIALTIARPGVRVTMGRRLPPN